MIAVEELVGRVVDERTTTYRSADTMLYALATGVGADPLDHRELRHVYEDGLRALPCMSLVVGYPGFWLKQPAYAVDWPRVLHAEEAFEIHAALPVAATVSACTRITAVVDRADKGAFIHSTKEVRYQPDGTLLATVHSVSVARGDGGGGSGGTPPPPVAATPPTRAPDVVCDLPTLPQQALLYRLCGDLNPLHADPAVARQAGFERPILHGRCTMAVAQHALIRSICDYDATRLRAMRVRFTAPFLPGETLRTRIWHAGARAYFDAASVERGVTVLGHGVATLTGH